MMRARPFRVWAAPAALAAFLFSLYICCFCGPLCGEAAAMEELDVAVSAPVGCCSSHIPAPVPETAPCCPDEPGDNCCEHDISEHALQHTVSSVLFSVPAVVFESGSLTALPEVRASYSPPQPNHATHGPPPYLRFQILLI